MIVGLLWAPMAHAFGLAAASVEFVSGEVRIVGRDGAARAALTHSRIFPGETVATGREARVVLRFSDGGSFALQPETRLRIVDYRFSGRPDGGERSYVSLIKGGLRAITGAIGRHARQNFRVITPTATIGVRGTQYAIRYTSTLVASVSDGEIQLCNGGGCRRAVRGEAYYVTAPDTEPVLVAGPDPQRTLVPIP
jgi:hypothetical protein